MLPLDVVLGRVKGAGRVWWTQGSGIRKPAASKGSRDAGCQPPFRGQEMPSVPRSIALRMGAQDLGWSRSSVARQAAGTEAFGKRGGGASSGD